MYLTAIFSSDIMQSKLLDISDSVSNGMQRTKKPVQTAGYDITWMQVDAMMMLERRRTHAALFVCNTCMC